MASVTESITAVRNGQIREFVLDISTDTLYDIAAGETRPMKWENLIDLKRDLKQQGFRFLPFNPDNVEMSPAARDKFRELYDY